MAKKELIERIAAMLADVIEEEIQDGDELKDAIKEQIDWEDVAKDMMADPEVKKQILEQARQLVIKLIKEADSVGDLSNDSDFNLIDKAFGDNGFAEFVSNDKEIREIVESRVRQLAKKEIKDNEELSNFATSNDTDDDDNIKWGEIIFGAKGGLVDLFKTDEDLRNTAKDMVRKQLLLVIKKFDDSDMPEWEDIIEALDVKKIIAGLLKEDEVLAEVKALIKEALSEEIKNNIDSDVLPGDFSETHVAPIIQQILENPGEAREFQEKLKEVLSGDIVSRITDNSEFLRSVLSENKNVQTLIDRVLDSIFDDKKTLENLKNGIKRRLNDEGEISDMLFKKLISVFTDRLIDKLLK